MKLEEETSEILDVKELAHKKINEEAFYKVSVTFFSRKPPGKRSVSDLAIEAEGGSDEIVQMTRKVEMMSRQGVEADEDWDEDCAVYFFGDEEAEASDDDWRRESAVMAGMAHGAQGFNEAMGYGSDEPEDT